METYSLPGDFSNDYTSPIQVIDYISHNSQEKNKIDLKSNVFSFILDGQKTLIRDQEISMIKNSNFILIKKGHCLMSETISESRKTFRSILLAFSDEILFNFVEKNKISIPKSPCTKSYHVIPYDRFIYGFVQSLEKIKDFKKSTQDGLLRIKFEEIMFYLLATKGHEFINSLISNKDNKSSHFINVVENNKLEKLKLHEIAFLCNMSLTSFKKKFQEHFKTSPIKWFQDRRLEHAAFLLKTEKVRPKEVYEKAGFSTLSNFTQAFKRKFNVTPKKFQLEENKE